MQPCPFCFTTTDRGPIPVPFTREDLRWYFADAEAAMGMRSSHGAVEALLASGPPPLGGQANAAENRMLRVISFPGERLPDGRLKQDPVARHRCIRNHRLAEVSGHHHAVLRAAYDGEDWTRTLDERVGYGSRLELQRLFPHELLQVAPLTPLVQRALRPKKLTPLPGTPVYRNGAEMLASVGVALSLPSTASVGEIRARLRDVALWLSTGRLPKWTLTPNACLEGLRAATGERGEARQVLLAARERVSEGIRLSTTPELAMVVGPTKKPPAPPATAQSYLLKLLAGGRKETLAKVRAEAERMLSEACAAAHVVTISRSKPRKPRKGTPRSTPLAAVEMLTTEEGTDALCA